MFKFDHWLITFSAVFRQYYQPARELSVDEMIFPKKPTKFGMKVFMNSEAKTGYVLTFQICTGKRESSSLYSKGVSYRVVMDLLSPYLGKGHWVLPIITIQVLFFSLAFLPRRHMPQVLFVRTDETSQKP